MNMDDYGHLVGLQDIRTQETEAVRRAKEHIAGLRSQMAICEAVTSLTSDSRFTIFGNELVRMRNEATRALIQEVDPGRLHQLQGAAQAFDKILTIVMAKDHERKQLALALQEAENQAQVLGTDRGKVNPAGALWGQKVNDDGRSQQRVDRGSDPSRGQVPPGEHHP